MKDGAPTPDIAAGTEEAAAVPLDAFTWASWRGEPVLVAQLSELEGQIGRRLLERGVHAGQQVNPEFSRNYVDRSGQDNVWWSEDDPATELLADTLCVTVPLDELGKKLTVGAYGGNKKNRVSALGLALAIAAEVHVPGRFSKRRMDEELGHEHFLELVANARDRRK